jgi:hypothetical protein
MPGLVHEPDGIIDLKGFQQNPPRAFTDPQLDKRSGFSGLGNCGVDFFSTQHIINIEFHHPAILAQRIVDEDELMFFL